MDGPSMQTFSEMANRAATGPEDMLRNQAAVYNLNKQMQEMYMNALKAKFGPMDMLNQTASNVGNFQRQTSPFDQQLTADTMKIAARPAEDFVNKARSDLDAIRSKYNSLPPTPAGVQAPPMGNQQQITDQTVHNIKNMQNKGARYPQSVSGPVPDAAHGNYTPDGKIFGTYGMDQLTQDQRPSIAPGGPAPAGNSAMSQGGNAPAGDGGRSPAQMPPAADVHAMTNQELLMGSIRRGMENTYNQVPISESTEKILPAALSATGAMLSRIPLAAANQSDQMAKILEMADEYKAKARTQQEKDEIDAWLKSKGIDIQATKAATEEYKAANPRPPGKGSGRSAQDPNAKVDEKSIEDARNEVGNTRKQLMEEGYMGHRLDREMAKRVGPILQDYAGSLRTGAAKQQFQSQFGRYYQAAQGGGNSPTNTAPPNGGGQVTVQILSGKMQGQTVQRPASVVNAHPELYKQVK